MFRSSDFGKLSFGHTSRHDKQDTEIKSYKAISERSNARFTGLLRERYNSCFEAYTHGSKCDQKVAAATYYPKDPDNSGLVPLHDGSFFPFLM